jgi:protein TonB
MFSNLVESSSHRAEIKRRSTFLLFTTATYGLLLVIAGVASVYAYDARLREQDLDLTVLTFAPPPEPAPLITPPQRVRPTHSAGATSNVSQPIRTVLFDSVNNPTNVPRGVSVVAQPIPPAPPNAIRGLVNVDPPTPGRNGVDNSGRPRVDQVVTNSEPPPTPKPTPTAVGVMKVSTVLNGKAVQLPKPLYPPIARVSKAQGVVTVQVLIDEVGKVISAKAVSGHPLLVLAAQQAAYEARFSPTLIGEQPVKVSGVITYNFILH